ncbi:MAG: hypothetical protein ACF8CQ_17325 [Rhodopirellula sp. JB044]|uniref:hypothetical protein n=1 Tax=Rhodopirellula sp. JB044 TaxID=3342844 RepID=UPI00370CC4A0
MPSEPIPADESPKKDPQSRVPRSAVPKLLPPTNTGRYVTGASGHGEAMFDSGLVEKPPTVDRTAVDAAKEPGSDATGTDSNTDHPDGTASRSGNLQTPDDIATEMAFDDIAVEEMVRDLELETRGDDGPADEDSSTNANEDDFAVIGVQNFEWRLSVIRIAAHRSADAIAASQLVEPSCDKEEKLARIVLSTYRLIDPRFRPSYFQQVRVGRLLPLALQRAACIDFTPPTLQTRSRVSRNESVRLFGHPFPIRVDRKHDSTRKKRRRAASHGDDVSSRDEALEVLAELRAFSTATTVRRWMHDTRFLSAMIIVIAATTVGLGVFAARRRMILPRSGLNQPVSTQANAASGPAPDVLAASDAEAGLIAVDAVDSDLTQLPDRSMPHVAASDAEIGSAAMTTDELLAALAEVGKTPLVTRPLPIEALSRSSSNGELLPGGGLPGEGLPGEGLPMTPNGDMPDIASIDGATDGSTDLRSRTLHDGRNADDMSAGAGSSSLLDWMPEISLPELFDLDVSSAAANTPSSRELPIAETAEPDADVDAAESSAMNDDASTPAVAMPRDTSAPEPPVHSDEEIATAVSELWTDTESAARRFTVASAGSLIEQWDLIAEIAAPESLEYAAAHDLIRQAAWLTHPVSDIVASLRQTAGLQVFRFADVSHVDAELRSMVSLTGDEVDRLLASWRASRRRVVASADVERMLVQANVLLDRIVTSDRIDASKRSALLDDFRTEVERLAKIVSNEQLLAETDELFTAISNLPASTEWTRLLDADQPSGLLGTIYCLQQRRWEDGIVWLGQSSNLVVAGCAKAECELLQSGGPDSSDAEWIALADRWTKVAQRLSGREAASIRWHALQIYGNDESTADQRKELIDALPQYMRSEFTGLP